MRATTNCLYCPFCHAEHDNLRGVFTCHPVETRRLSDSMFSAREPWVLLASYLTGAPVPDRYVRVMRGEIAYMRGKHDNAYYVIDAQTGKRTLSQREAAQARKGDADVVLV